VRALVASLASAALLGLQQVPPPPFPRPGASLLLENDAVRVWDIAWLKQSYPLHRHPYDMTGVYYQSGDRIIISPEGERRSTHTEAWGVTFQRTGLTHSEEGASDVPLRAVFIEMKRSPGADASSPPRGYLPVGSVGQALDNDRVTVWEYGANTGTTANAHRHARDAVVVSFDSSGHPGVAYFERGTTHDADAPGAARYFVFEIK
jgi:hypothetical protein